MPKQKNVKKEYKKVKEQISREGADVQPQTFARLAELEISAGHDQEAAKLYERAGDKAKMIAANSFGIIPEVTMAETLGIIPPKVTRAELWERANKYLQYYKKADEIYEHLLPEKRSFDHKLRKKSIWDIIEKVSPPVAIIGLILGIFFFSSNFTGNVIWNITNLTSNYIGVILLILGLVGSLFWFRSRRR